MGSTLERLDHLLSRLGYCSRSEVRQWLRQGRIRLIHSEKFSYGSKVDPRDVRVDGEALDSPEALYLLYHKDLGTVCAHDDPRSIYNDFPQRWRFRRPVLSSAGRLDRETSGLLLLSDDGQWLHRLSHSRNAIPRRYLVQIDTPLPESAETILASGTLRLEGEEKPCAPAQLERLDSTHIRLTLREGRYHEVRRIMVALGSQVLRLHREAFGPYELGDLPPGGWRLLSTTEIHQEY